ncbi:MAG: hypothetical protein ACTSR8_22515 [Promethearchaeota archaeon]
MIEEKSEKTVPMTIRIKENINNSLEEIKSSTGISKAELIRNYLNMSNYVLAQKGVLKSLNNRDLIIVKKSFLRSIIRELPEIKQADLGEKLGRFINDIATIKGKSDDIDYKLDLCVNYGFFPRFIDNDGYIMISKKFGPQRFTEAFLWQIIKNMDYNLEYIENPKGTSKSYGKEIGYKENRTSSHYSFEFAKLKK